MNSIGNDIVDLNFIDKQRTCDSRFYSKILSPAEQELYRRPQAAQIPFEVYVWLLWSAKEAAYKFLKRHQPELVFSPVRIVVQELENQAHSLPVLPDVSEVTDFTDCSAINLKLSYQGKGLDSRSIITSEYIATFISDDFERTYWGIKKIDDSDPDNQSAQVRLLARQHLQRLFTSREIRIEKSFAGIPIIYWGINEMPIPLSFSHHGLYISYAFSLSQY